MATIGSIQLAEQAVGGEEGQRLARLRRVY
jgi:hypothetical protein